VQRGDDTYTSTVHETLLRDGDAVGRGRRGDPRRSRSRDRTTLVVSVDKLTELPGALGSSAELFNGAFPAWTTTVRGRYGHSSRCGRDRQAASALAALVMEIQ
jgi:hypothetical protein